MQKQIKALFLATSLMASVSLPSLLHAQAPAAASAANRLVGALVKVDGQKLTLKDQQGAEQVVTITDATRILQIAPGQTSLAGATPIHITDIQPGDRLLVRLQAAPDSSGMVATTVVAMKQADIAQQHASTLAAWQHGVGGLVKQVDAANNTVVITTNGIAHPKTVTIHLEPKTIVKRYAAESVQYEQAQASSLDKIAVGDQLRARGKAGTDPADFVADEVIAGSFRSISGRITSVDPASGIVSLTDLATKQPVQLKVTSDSQLRKLDDATADKLAAEMKSAEGNGGKPEGAGAPGGAPPGAAGSGGPPPGAATGNAAGGGAPGGYHGAGGGPGAGGAGANGGSDMQQALAHAASIQLAQLKKGDLVMAVASNGAGNELGAVTMVTGVEPLLRSSPNASAAGLSSWSLGGGGAGGGDQ
jgi:hypothetical protein